MAFYWNKELETGNSAIDSQHRQLINAFNNLLDACAEQRGRQEIDNTIDFLYKYTVKHFEAEEQLQQQYNYPDYNEHRQCHEYFRAEVVLLRKQLFDEGATLELLGKVNSVLLNWLITHIKGKDTSLADYICNNKKSVTSKE